LDQARLYALLLDSLGIERVHAVIGASMGGMTVMQFARHYPQRYERVAIICATAQTSSSTQALRFVQRAAVRADPDFHDGNYADVPAPGNGGPQRGLAIARMFGTICYRSREEFDNRFDHKPILPVDGSSASLLSPPSTAAAPAAARATAPIPPLFEVESYLQHAASTFTGRYDANCYLTLSQCMDLMDIAQRVAAPPPPAAPAAHAAAETAPAPHADTATSAPPPPSPSTSRRHTFDESCAMIPQSKQFLLLPIASDALIPPAELERLGAVLGSQGKRVHVERVHSIFGHDAFLKDAEHTFNPRIACFLDASVADGVGNVRRYVNSTLDL